uniref:Si:ch73-330k17.3 n=1 Tax=Lepisosteus oculatus TaxID=7918 RepID=W5N8M6_LEPOC
KVPLVLALAVWILELSGAQGPREGVTLQALHCPECERIHCTPKRALKLQCKGGITTGICGCCPVCARIAGESCGGKWDYLGKCDEGLSCVYQDLREQESTGELKGICTEVLQMGEEEKEEVCRPQCTWEFCRDNPSEICSARAVVLESRDCQGRCQHTSCSSCFVIQQPRCHEACPSSSDLPCLRRFGRCVHRGFGQSQEPACHQGLQTNAEGFFVCLVPSCSSTA